MYVDVLDGFKQVLNHPNTCPVFLMRHHKDKMPTLDITRAERKKDGEPIIFPATYDFSSYGFKDLSCVFSYCREIV